MSDVALILAHEHRRSLGERRLRPDEDRAQIVARLAYALRHAPVPADQAAWLERVWALELPSRDG